MGDRANVFVKDREDGGIYLYTHWSGTELPMYVQCALLRAPDRRDDLPYLSRVILDDMTGTDRGTAGFGISSAMCDNGHRIVCVRENWIGFAEEGMEVEGPFVCEWTHDEYCALTESEIMSAYDESYEPEEA